MNDETERHDSVQLLPVKGEYFVEVNRPGFGSHRQKYRNRAEAERGLALTLSRLGKSVPADDVTYNELYGLWIKNHVAAFLSPSYLIGLDEEHRRFFRPTIGENSLAHLESDPSLVVTVWEDMIRRFGRSYADTMLRGPKAAMNKAIRWGFMTSNPIKACR